jgi:thymidylate kinase
MREAPHSILLLLKASPEVIRQRMKDDPHEYQVVRDGDVETVLERFEERFDASGIRRKLTLDTTSATVEETLAEFDAQIQQYLTDSDRQRILTKRALSG